MEQIFSVFQTLFDAWTAVSFVFALIGIASLIFVVVGCISGVTQATVRFGLALFGKKVAIFANADDYHIIESDLTSSGLIKKKNIERVSADQRANLNEALLIVFACRADNKEYINEVVNRKNSRCGLIVYCPSGPGVLSAQEIATINSSSFTTVCNFRGRLVNDVLLMMLSTSFKKKDLK